MKIFIEKKFKDALMKRFNPQNAKELSFGYVIMRPCPICAHYGKCGNCPLYKEEENYNCCGTEWIEKTLSTKYEKRRFYIRADEIGWSKIYDPEAREQLQHLLAKAEKEIEWI